MAVSKSLGIPYLDKDHFLERLYEKEGVGNWSWRKNLSRKSDDAFQHEAQRLNSAVLVSHWRPRGGSDESGTPTAWLGETYRSIVEVYCSCPPELSAARFVSRRRHPGHLDDSRDHDKLVKRLYDLAAGYPLGIGILIEVNTEERSNLLDLIAQVKGIVSGSGRASILASS
jgi:hypothetical protein